MLTSVYFQGYTYSVFNLVYETNVASCRIWDSLGFKRIGRVPSCGNLKSHPDRLIDAIIYGRELGQEGEEETMTEERFDKIRSVRCASRISCYGSDSLVICNSVVTSASVLPHPPMRPLTDCSKILPSPPEIPSLRRPRRKVPSPLRRHALPPDPL